MFSLTYVSTATVHFTRSQLQDLLIKSRSNNEALGITGLLLFKDGNFMQTLEGDEPAVRALYDKIANDSRHSGSSILLIEHPTGRAFGEWAMAYRDLNDAAVRATPGFSTFLNQNPDETALFRDPTPAQRLLQFFRQNMR